MAEFDAAGGTGRVCPHTPQNFAFGRGIAPQFGQEVDMIRLVLGLGDDYIIYITGATKGDKTVRVTQNEDREKRTLFLREFVYV